MLARAVRPAALLPLISSHFSQARARQESSRWSLRNASGVEDNFHEIYTAEGPSILRIVRKFQRDGERWGGVGGEKKKKDIKKKKKREKTPSFWDTRLISVSALHLLTGTPDFVTECCCRLLVLRKIIACPDHRYLRIRTACGKRRLRVCAAELFRRTNRNLSAGYESRESPDRPIDLPGESAPETRANQCR